MNLQRERKLNYEYCWNYILHLWNRTYLYGQRWSVKIETQGSGGVEFALTDEDINAADCVLIASDVAVSGTERFKGKPMVKVPVATAIKSPEHLLRKIEEKLGAMKK